MSGRGIGRLTPMQHSGTITRVIPPDLAYVRFGDEHQELFGAEDLAF